MIMLAGAGGETIVADVPQKADVYADQFQMQSSPYGVALVFSVLVPQPPVPGKTPPSEPQATVRMSVEHAKVVAFLMRRQILVQERQAGVVYSVPAQVLNAMGVSPEDWDAFWDQP